MIEIDITKLERGTREGWVTVKRGGKVFRRRQRLGQKEVSPSPKDVNPPNPEIMAAMQYAHKRYEETNWQTDGFTEVNEKTGEFTYSHGRYMDWSDGKGIERIAESAEFRLIGNNITCKHSDMQVTIPESEITDAGKYYKRDSPKWFNMLDDKWGNTMVKANYMRFMDEPEEYDKRFNEIDNFTPEYEDEFEVGSAKYGKRMGLKACSHIQRVADIWVAAQWYNGNRDYTALVGEAVQEVVKGRYNPNNVIQQQIPLMMKAAKKINKAHGKDTIYRGETNIENAKDILEQLDEFGDVDIADKLFSCTENEKLAKWYASTHNQNTARGGQTKSHMILKIPREKFGDNVIMDYRSTGSSMTPEEEVTIVGNDMTLTGDNVMVQAKTSKRKTKKWMTFTQFKTEGGLIEDLISQMKVK